MERVQFTTVVWGTWHVDAFLSFAIPSLLAPNNLPAFVNRHHSLYHIVTSESDADRFRESEVFSSLQSAMPVRLVVLEAEAFVGDTLDSHIRNQQQRSQEAIAAARVRRRVAHPDPAGRLLGRWLICDAVGANRAFRSCCLYKICPCG